MTHLVAEPWDYLSASEAIDIEHPVVLSAAARLQAGDDVAYAGRAFEFVRDEIRHSLDAGDHRVTWRASDVIEQRTGLCYAKAHAYVALLRAGGVPAGFCYQRLKAGNDDGGGDGGGDDHGGGGHVLHGLAAVQLADRWIRLDPRGNRPGVRVDFSATEDRLAFPVRPESGEADYPAVYVHPHPIVLAALRAHDDCQAMCAGGGLPTGLPEQ